MNHNRIKLLEEYIREDPSDPFNHYALALELAAEDPDRAISVLLSLLKEKPQYLPTYYQAALLLLEQNRIEEARIALTQGIKLAIQQNNHKTIKELKQLQQELD